MGVIGILTGLARPRDSPQWSLLLTFNFLYSPHCKWIRLTYTTNWYCWSVTFEPAIKDIAASALEACSLLDQSVLRKPAIMPWSYSSSHMERGLHGKERKLRANSQCQLVSHVNETPWKRILQPYSNLQMRRQPKETPWARTTQLNHSHLPDQQNLRVR